MGWHALVLTLFALAAVEPAASPDGPLEELLLRAGAYVQEYHTRLTAIVAEEHYVQRVSGPLRAGARASALQGAGTHDEERTLRSDFMLLRGGAGEDPWFAFRDVFEVDGRKVSSQRGRLEAWLGRSRSSLMQGARALALEQARYNIGPVVRTINVPTLVLEFLMPENQDRFRFRRTGSATLMNMQVSILSFDERRRRTMIRTPEGKDVVARGAVWVDTATGRVIRTELRTGGRERGHPAATIRVEYGFEPRLDMLVPISMEERYVAGPTEIACTATYSNFRRFETGARIIR